jgi:formylglycine-generating enzyme required for sulfatase activity
MALCACLAAASAVPAVAQTAPAPLAGLGHRELVEVPGATYDQRCPKPADTPLQWEGTTGFRHEVGPFSLGKYDVTYELWRTVVGWALDRGYFFAGTGAENPLPIDKVKPGDAWTYGALKPAAASWRDAIVWCNAYSEISGLMPVYYADAERKLPIRRSSADQKIFPDRGSVDAPFVDWKASGYCLPTEGEWQLAASYVDGETWTPFNYASGATTFYSDTSDNCPANGIPDGKDADDLVAVYWLYWDGAKVVPDGEPFTAEVGTKRPNSLGLYDMSGNIGQWCWDWRSDCPSGEQKVYRGPDTGKDGLRVVKGGTATANWGASSLMIGWRDYGYPWGAVNKNGYKGFRVARSRP